MKNGNSGMGMHKHGVSGRASKSGFVKLMAEKDANKRIEEKKKPKARMYTSFKELFK